VEKCAIFTLIRNSHILMWQCKPHSHVWIIVQGTKTHTSVITQTLNLWSRVKHERGIHCENVFDLKPIPTNVKKWVSTLRIFLKYSNKSANRKQNPNWTFFKISQKSSNVNIRIVLASSIWRFTNQVMVKRVIGGQIGNLVPNH
jgi:hypothetical protein